MDFKVRLSVFLSLFDLKYSALFLKHLQDGIGSTNMGLKPFFAINIIVNESFEPAYDEIEPFDPNDIPSLLFCEVWEENLLDVFE